MHVSPRDPMRYRLPVISHAFLTKITRITRTLELVSVCNASQAMQTRVWSNDCKVEQSHCVPDIPGPMFLEAAEQRGLLLSEVAETS